jgi:hypothetical protein
MQFRRVLAAALACYFTGCAVSAETTGGQFNQINRGMTREQVVGSLGEPAETSLVNGAPSEDLWSCDHQGQIMVVKYSPIVTTLETILIVPIWVDAYRLRNLDERSRKCAVHYDQDRVLSTSLNNGLVFSH